MFFTGKINVSATAELLRVNNCISADVVLLFDEIYLQKCKEYFAGESFGSDDAGNLHKGMMMFMIVGLTNNVPYVLHAVPENNIRADWLKEEILKCIQCLQSKGFKVRACVSDNHSTNVSAYQKLLEAYGKDEDDLRIYVEDMPIYLFHDTVHIVKNIRNNLLNQKRLIFPPFISNDLEDLPVEVKGGEITWSLLHKVRERDMQCQANLRAAPKLQANVLHPGNCKQNVTVALAIFNPSTIAAIRHYFPEHADSAGFLELVNIWWTISNSKSRFNSHYKLGNAAVKGDGKPQFLRSFASWLEIWKQRQIPNSQKFTLSGQTNAALVRTLRCHASLIEDLLSEGQQYVLTARFQSDPIERRFGQYRQMSGGRFLISEKDIITSEKIVKIKTLVKEGLQLDSNVLSTEEDPVQMMNLMEDVEGLIGKADNLKLNDESRQVSDTVAGYVAHKTEHLYKDCCHNKLIKNQLNTEYIGVLSRGGLKNPSLPLSIAVSQAFAILDASSTAIRKSGVPARKAGIKILKQYLNSSFIVCDRHNDDFCNRLRKVICNCFFNNERKRVNDSIVKYNVAEFKRVKRQKT